MTDQTPRSLSRLALVAVVLACAEASELIRPGEMSIPTLDSNRLLARAALAASLE